MSTEPAAAHFVKFGVQSSVVQTAMESGASPEDALNQANQATAGLWDGVIWRPSTPGQQIGSIAGGLVGPFALTKGAQLLGDGAALLRDLGSSETVDAMHSATASGSEVFHGPGMTRLGSDGASVRVSQNVAPLDGYHDVVVHGGAYDESGAIFYVDGQPTNANQVATAILENPSYTPGQPVRLITCWGGCGPAQEVSDILQVPVKGANNIVAVPNKPLSPPFVMNGGSRLDFTPQ